MTNPMVFVIQTAKFYLWLGITSVIIFLNFSQTAAQSPTCDIPGIMATFQGAGYVPLVVQGQPCSIYFVNPNSQSAAAAQSAASTLGANLVVMNDAAENANVTAALVASPYNGATIWIGYQRTSTGSSTFYASDGTTGNFAPTNGNPAIYQNWAGGEPNNNGYGDTDFFGGCDWECTNGEQCVQIYPGGQWNDLACNESSISVIEVNLCPEITVVASTNNVCAGIPVTLTASTLLGSTPYQYLWSTNETTPAITVSPVQTTTYDVGVVDRYQCSAQESVTVTTLAGPSSTFSFTGPVCVGDPLTITYTGSGTAGATYDWNFDGGTIVSGSGQGPYTISWATSGNKNVTLQVTENGCPSLVESQVLTVSETPTADFTFTVECESSPTVFTNTSVVGGGATITNSAWDFGGGNLSTDTDPTYTFPSSGPFPVTLGILSSDGCPAQTTIQVTVNPGPSVVFNSTDVVCFGACDGTAEAVIQGGAAPVAVTWSNGDLGSNIANLCPGPYTGTVTDANGCAVVGQVTVIEPTELTVVIDVTETTCPGINDGTASDNPSGGTPPYQVDWGGEDPNALAPGDYMVTITDGKGCILIEPYTIIEGAGLSLDFVITDNICFGGSSGAATLTVSNGAAPYDIIWTDAFSTPLQSNIGSQGVENITGLGAGTYNVAVQDAVGCALITSITVTQPVVGLVMNLTPQDLNCFESSDGQIDANQNGLSPYTFDISDVFGVPITSGQDAASYSFQGLDIGIYFVTITDANGCTTTDAVELFQPEPLAIESTVFPVPCFQGSNGSIDITQITGGTTPYVAVSWNDPNAQTGNTAADLSAGTYTSTLVDANGCQLQTNFTLIDPPKMILTPGYLTDTCGQGKGAALVNAELGTPPYSYLWKPDGVTSAVHYNLYEGSYEVVVMDANGCQDSVFSVVTDDLPHPSAAFDYRIEGEHFLEQEVQFINNSSSTIQWIWNFGDGLSSFDEDPRHQYENPGNYLVQLLASNGYCYDTAYNYVNIDPLLVVYIPNAFTPSETENTLNGINDYFYPQGEGIEEDSYDMFIFDRWGKIIWQTGKFGQKWDGRHMNSLKPMPTGIYVYQITFREFADLDRYVYNGVVHLIRQ